jgi:CRISPR-associated protein Csb2
MLQRVEGPSARSTLKSAVWARPSRSWISATPIALDRNPGDLTSADPARAERAHHEATETIALACRNVGLPPPTEVEVRSSVPLQGAQKARAFPPFPVDPKKTRRVLVHARISFAEPVRGPILLGAGRYLGLGLMRPIGDDHV